MNDDTHKGQIAVLRVEIIEAYLLSTLELVESFCWRGSWRGEDEAVEAASESSVFAGASVKRRRRTTLDHKLPRRESARRR